MMILMIFVMMMVIVTMMVMTDIDDYNDGDNVGCSNNNKTKKVLFKRLWLLQVDLECEEIYST